MGTGCGIFSCYSMIALPLERVVMTPLSAPGAKEHHGIEGAGGPELDLAELRWERLWNQHPGSPHPGLCICVECSETALEGSLRGL